MKKSTESAVLCITDVHVGKETKSFGMNEVRSRIKELAKTVARIADLMKSGIAYEELVILFLGDINDGTLIYKTQAHHQAETDVNAQAMFAVEDVFVPFINNLSKIFPKIVIYGVPGNHGFASRFAHEASNWDIVFYNYLKLALKTNKKVECNFDTEFMKVVRVQGKGILIYHGHSIKAYQQIPWYGMFTRLMRWHTTKKFKDWDMATMGHFHTFGLHSLNRIFALMNGTLVSDDEWALETLGYESTNRWWMFGVSKKRVLTWSHGLELTNP